MNRSYDQIVQTTTATKMLSIIASFGDVTLTRREMKKIKGEKIEKAKNETIKIKCAVLYRRMFELQSDRHD